MKVQAEYGPAPSFAYMPALDGMRAICIVMVMISHFGMGSFVPGGFGVTIFFFISGLLITRQLLAEARKTGGIDLFRFMMRRQLRLYPALLTVILLSAGAFLALGGRLPLHRFLAALFYYYNYFDIAQTSTSGRSSPFDPLWSLAVEEHFYLLFPLLVAWLGGREGRFARMLAASILTVTLWRCAVVYACNSGGSLCWGDPLSRSEAATDTRIDSILYGAWFATMLAADQSGRLLRLISRRTVFLLGLALIVLSLVLRNELFRQSLRYTIQGLALLPVAGGVLFAPFLSPVRALLSGSFMRLLGRLSYSLYLWHWVFAACLLQIAFGAVEPQTPEGRALLMHAAPLLLPLSFGAACLSYYGVERPLLHLRRRFGSHAPAERPASAEVPRSTRAAMGTGD
jgi:peptidoglycan/LPS O-acetylase OafA/YrhL